VIERIAVGDSAYEQKSLLKASNAVIRCIYIGTCMMVGRGVTTGSCMVHTHLQLTFQFGEHISSS